MNPVARQNPTHPRNQQVGSASTSSYLLSTWRMFRLWLGLVLRCIHSRGRLLMENLALRQQLSALKRWHPRPKLMPAGRLFWLLARRRWSGWKGALILVSPETVVRWHRAGFRGYWSMFSKRAKDSLVSIWCPVCRVPGRIAGILETIENPAIPLHARGLQGKS